MDKISARDAFELGKKRYFTGEPCKYGHISERMISNGSCLECLKKRRSKDKDKAKNPLTAYERTKQWRIDNPGARAQEAARYRKKHPDVVFAAQKKYRETHKEEIKIRDAENKRRLRKLNPLAEKARLAKFVMK